MKHLGATIFFATFSLLVLTVVPAKANLLPFLSSVVPDASGNTTFDYSVSLSNDERMDGAGSGNVAFFTIYDFAGYVPGTAVAPAGWTVTVQDLGITPPHLIVPDDPTVANLTFTYVGSATVIGTGQTFVGFSADSIYSSVNNSAYFSQESTKNAGPATGGLDVGAGPEDVPLAVSQTPEPSTLLLLGAGLGLVAFKARKRIA